MAEVQNESPPESLPLGPQWSVGRRAALIVAVLIALAGTGLYLSFPKYTVEGASMAPTYESGDSIFVNRWASGGRGDVVVAVFKDRNERIKRIVGVGGDALVFENCVLTRNGRRVDEPFTEGSRDHCGAGFETVVPDGELFLLGDNRGGSQDSRNLGSVPTADVRGVVAYHR